MIRSLRTGVSGMLAQQNSLDVVSDNISNANTVGFKRSRAAFSEQLGQELLGVSRSRGGSSANPAFIGQGTEVASVDKNWEQGSFEETNIRTDLALSGDGFFLADQDGRNVMTRDGNMSFDEDGFLVTAGGLRVQGYGTDAEGDIDTSSVQDIELDQSARIEPQFTENAEVAGNLASEKPGWDPNGDIALDAPSESRVTVSSTVFDEQGEKHDLLITFAKTEDANEWQWAVEDPDGVFEDEDTGNDSIAHGDLTFNTDGSVETIDVEEGTLADANDDGDNDSVQLTWDEDFADGELNLNIFDEISQFGGSTTAQIRNQDGYGPGELVGFDFDQEGRLVKSFSNGQQEFAGQLALGEVSNPQGLEQIGDNLYGATPFSGDMNIGRAGQEIDTAVQAGKLEQSNVDLATEFTDMIEAQRGYQAASRTITTSDEILQETVQLKR